jgi:hypothetical protein
LAYGNEEIFNQESQLAKMDCYRVAVICQPVEEVEMPFDATSGWYVWVFDSHFKRSEIEDLHDPEVYELVPNVIKVTMDCLGALEDPDLLFIFYNLYTESVTIQYHPKYDEDLEFYKSKFQALRICGYKI